MINLKSQRLQIRNFLASDAKDLLEIYSSPELQKYIDDETLESVDDAKRLLKRYQGPHPFDNKLGVFAVVERSINKVIGTALLVPLRDHEGNFLSDIEVGYHINKNFWNKGYATEVSRCLIQYAFDDIGLSDLYAVVLPDNNSSIRVLEKSGMQFHGTTNEFYGKNLHKFKIASSNLQARIDLFEKFGIGLKRDNIVVLKDHNPKWKSLFNSEKKVIEQNLGIDSLNLHHCGSTAISHICAKPIIDILGEIEDINLLDKNQKLLEELGYEYKGEYGLSGRRYCVLYNAEKDTGYVHLHIYQKGHSAIIQHLAFCRYLESNINDALAYQDLKRKLQQLPRKEYSPAKSNFVAEILSKIDSSGLPRQKPS